VKRRIRGVYLIKMFGPFNQFVGGTRMSIEPPVENNLARYIEKWKELNPWARVARYTARFEGCVDETRRN